MSPQPDTADQEPRPSSGTRQENGRGTPTLAALDRLARALGTELSVDLGQPGSGPAVGLPASLVRVARTEQFRGVTVERAGPDRNAGEVATALVDLLARVGPALGIEPDDVDWWRLLDALLLIGRFGDVVSSASIGAS